MADTATQRRRVNWPKATSVDWLRGAALVGLCLDATTTLYILTVGTYSELNPIISAFWSIDPAIVSGYFAVFFAVVWLATRRRHWLSTTISWVVLLVVGISGGLNNIALLLFGPPSLLSWLATVVSVSKSTLLLFVLPVCGLAVALVGTRLIHGRLPWGEVVAVVGSGTVGYLLYLSAAQLLLGVPTVAL